MKDSEHSQILTLDRVDELLLRRWTAEAEVPPLVLITIGTMEGREGGFSLDYDLKRMEKRAHDWAAALVKQDSRRKILLLPPIPLGVDRKSKNLALRVRGHVLRDFLVDWCDSLAEMNLTRFLCLTLQPSPRDLTAIEDASKLLRRKRWFRMKIRPLFTGEKFTAPSLVSLCSSLLPAEQIQTSFFGFSPSSHGDEKEREEALQLKRWIESSTRSAPIRVSAPHAPVLQRLLSSLAPKRSGCWEVSEKSGSRLPTPDEITPEKLALVLAWADEGRPLEKRFRSWFSLLPWNQTFFKSWALALSLSALLLFWGYLVVNFFLGEG